MDVILKFCLSIFNICHYFWQILKFREYIYINMDV